MAATPVLGFQLLSGSEQSPAPIVNDNLARLEAILGAVKSRSTTTPPTSPAAGDVYIRGATGTDAWATATPGDLMRWQSPGWTFYHPAVGLRLPVQDEALALVIWDGAAWVTIGTGSSFTLAADPTPTLNATLNANNQIVQKARTFSHPITAATFNLSAAADAVGGRLRIDYAGGEVTCTIDSLNWGAGDVDFAIVCIGGQACHFVIGTPANATLLNVDGHTRIMAGGSGLLSLVKASGTTGQIWMLSGATAE